VLSTSGDEATLLKLGKAPRVLKVVRTLKIVKVFRVLKIARTIQDIKDTVRGLGTFFKLFRLLLLTAFFLHINACLFALIGQSNERDTWINDLQIDFDDWETQYLNALYWSATTSTTVGFGDIVPTNSSEKSFVILSMCIGVCLYVIFKPRVHSPAHPPTTHTHTPHTHTHTHRYGYIIGSMTEMVTSTSYVDNKVQQQLDEVHAFIERHRLPRSLSRHILTFFRHHFKKKKMIDERHIMEMMPATLLKQCHAAILTESDMAMFHMVDSKHFPVIMDMLLPRTFDSSCDSVKSLFFQHIKSNSLNWSFLFY